MWCKYHLMNSKKMYGFLVGMAFCVLLLGKPVLAQQVPLWYSFTDPKQELTGYKDGSGKVKIPAQFGGFTRAGIFRNIIAVTDPKTYKSYYLLKDGRAVARDSTYVFDFTFDCEQEGKIRFRDPKTDKVGYLDRHGKVTITDMYNDARPFYNGMAVVLYNGTRLCPDGSLYDVKHPCEHWSWTGITALIDTTGRVVVDSLDYNMLDHLNWYSLQISDQPADTTFRDSFKAKDGCYYTFSNYEKEFKYWFYNNYLRNLAGKSGQHTFDLVSIEGLSGKPLRKSYSRKSFHAQFQQVLIKKLAQIRPDNKDLQIIPEELNYMIYTQTMYKPFYTDCGEANNAQYPLFDVVISFGTGPRSYQERYSFLRTSAGWKLIEVTWKDLK